MVTLISAVTHTSLAIPMLKAICSSLVRQALVVQSQSVTLLVYKMVAFLSRVIWKLLEQQIYKYVLENGSITTAETVEILDVKHRRARAVLLNMVKNGYLRKEGAARSTIYVKNTEGR